MLKFRRSNSFWILATFFIASCNTQPTSSTANNDAGAAATTSEGEHFGEKIAAEGAIPFAQLSAKMVTADSLKVKVRGTVEEVCQAKGCWMNIVSDQPAQSPMMVRFKDYGFFVPKDISGREVIIDGYAFRETTSIDELRHYAEDAGKSKEEIEAINTPKEELKFLASGVILLDQ